MRRLQGGVGRSGSGRASLGALRFLAVASQQAISTFKFVFARPAALTFMLTLRPDCAVLRADDQPPSAGREQRERRRRRRQMQDAPEEYELADRNAAKTPEPPATPHSDSGAHEAL